MAKLTRKDAFVLSLGDVFPQFKPKKKVKTQKPKRYRRKDKSRLDRFSKGYRVRCYRPNDPNHRLNGKIGIVCTEQSFGERKRYVVIRQAKKRTRTVPDEVAFQVTEWVDEKIEANGLTWFLTEEEYTLHVVMES
jgi:hypothetical protein